MPDEARDGRNVAFKFSSDCWHARLSKAEFLHTVYSTQWFIEVMNCSTVCITIVDSVAGDAADACMP